MVRNLYMAVLSVVTTFLGGLASVPGYAQMSMPGQFQVGETGAATYSIPIQLPPGIAGIEPALALSYSSQSGNGLVGVGWSLSGLGGIGRCPRTIAQDGIAGTVNYDANDRYCLDGQRLISISGTEGGDGTEYRTERESFARIVSYGAAGAGPAWFKVWTKSGQLMEYGRTADARIEAQGKVSIRVWALNRIEDSNGNYLAASYAKDQNNGDYYPSRIDYAGNNRTNSAPANSVQFLYEARPDTTPWYFGGALIKTVGRLNEIRIAANAEVSRIYRLTFSGGDAKKTLLSKISICQESGTCMPSIQFDWIVATPSFYMKEGSLSDEWLNMGEADTFQVTDNRIARLQGKALFVKENGVSSAWIPVQSDVDSYQLVGTRIGVLSNSEFFMKDGGISSAWLSLETGVESFQIQVNRIGILKNKTLFVKENGISEQWIRLADGVDSFQLTDNRIAVLKAGVLLVKENGVSSPWITLHTGVDAYQLEGDRIGVLRSGELSIKEATLSSAWTSMETGVESFQLSGNRIGILKNRTFYAKDGPLSGAWLNMAEGVESFLLTDNRISVLKNGALLVKENGISSAWISARINVKNSQIVGSRLAAQEYQAHEVISSIRRAPSEAINISYKAIVDGTVYLPEFSAVYPAVDVQSGLYVVSSVANPNGVGGETSTSYTYGGLKSDLSGRGFLGFRWTQSRQMETSLTAYAEYLQVWPYTGLPSLNKKSTTNGGSNGILSQTITTYACNDASSAGATSCAVGAGKRYFVYAKQSVESSWDYNGAALPVITTSTEYDNWGNAIKVDVTTDDGFKKSTINSYSNDSTNWYLGRLLKSSVTSSAP